MTDNDLNTVSKKPTFDVTNPSANPVQASEDDPIFKAANRFSVPQSEIMRASKRFVSCDQENGDIYIGTPLANMEQKQLASSKNGNSIGLKYTFNPVEQQNPVILV